MAKHDRRSVLSTAPRAPHQTPRTVAVAIAAAAGMTGTAIGQVQFQALPRTGYPVPLPSGWAFGSEFGDVDRDGDLDQIFGNWNGQNQLFRNDGFGNFTDVTATTMPVGVDSTQAIAFGDVDGDGDLDVVVGNYNMQNRLLINDGTGAFTDATAAQLPPDGDPTIAIALGDLDGDGDLDILCGNWNSANRLYRNDGSGAFTDDTAASLPATGSLTTSALALGDIDGDGDLDLVVGKSVVYSTSKYQFGSTNRLFTNDGAGHFTDVSSSQLPSPADFTTSLALGDIDGDGDLDLVVGNRGYTSQHTSPSKYWVSHSDRSRVYVNNGQGIFTDVTTSRITYDDYWTISIALGDVDADGDLDLVMGNGDSHYDSHFDKRNRLFLNNGAGFFTDVTAPRMPGDLDWTNLVRLADVDRDGDLDLFAGTGRLYQNMMSQLAAPLPFRIAQTYRLDAHVRFVPPGQPTFAWTMLSFGAASISLAPYGTLGIDPSNLVTLPMITIPQPTGFGSLNLSVPNLPGMLGLHIYSQAVYLHHPALPQLGNVVPDVLIQ